MRRAIQTGQGARVTDLLALCEPTYTERVAALFKARPGVWIPWYELARIGGAMAWRTRVSDVRKAPFLMTIENKIERREDGVKVSFYRWVPR